jgi:two-component system response regulator MprA
MLADMKVLVVDDDAAVRDSLARTLKFEGHEVATAADGREALDRLHEDVPDAMILDVSMPGLDGLEVCRRLREAGDRTPVLMLTARDAVDDRVAGLDAGADDYLVKPFALQELLARLRALMRRSLLAAGEPEAGTGRNGLLTFADLRLDPGTREVWRGDRPLRLTRTEFAILEVFLRHPRQVLTRAVLFEQVWGYDFGETSNSIHVYLGYLRRKLEAGGEPRLLHTVRGVGFVLREEPL